MNHATEDTNIEHMEKLIKYYEDVREGSGFTSVWSMWTADEWPDMDDYSGIPVGTMIRYWNYNGKSTTAMVKGITWLDVWAACELAIEASGDTHHIFIEGLSSTTIEKEDGTVEEFLDLITGS